MTYQHNKKDVQPNNEQEAHMVIDDSVFSEIFKDLGDLSEILEEKDPSPNEYLTIEQSLQFLKIPKSKIFEHIGTGLLRPCFLYDGNLIGSQYMGQDIEAFGYFRFRGYITPTLDTPIIAYLQSDEQKFELNQVKVVEKFSNAIAHLHVAYQTYVPGIYLEDGDLRGIEMRRYEYQIYSNVTYKICTEALKEITATFDTNNCMLIKAELIKIRDILKINNVTVLANAEFLTQGEGLSSDKINHILSINLLKEAILHALETLGHDSKALPLEKRSSKGGLRKQVREYITAHPKYGHLESLEHPYNKFNNYWKKLKKDKVLIYSNT